MPVVRPGSQFLACNAMQPEVHVKLFGQASHRITKIKLSYSCIASMHLHALPVALHCKPKYCEPAFTL